MQRRIAALVPHIEIIAQVVLLLFLAAAVTLFALHAAQAVRFRYPLDYGEAPLVDQALRLAAGENIYRPDLATPPYTISNYPPLYPLALALLVKLFGPSMIAGRWISILCAALTALLLAAIVGRLTRDRLAAAVAGLLFLAFPYVVGWSKLARVDLLALALSTAGLYVLVRWPASRWGIIGGALLLTAAIYTRQSYALAAPLAACVWLLTQNWRRALGLAVLVGGASLALFVVLNALTGGGFFYNIVTANVNEFKTDNLLRWWGEINEAARVLLLLGGLYLALGWRRHWAGAALGMDRTGRSSGRPAARAAFPLLAPYLAGAALSALTIGKIGSNMNYLLELCAALSLAAGAWVALSRGHPWLRAALLLLLALQTWTLIQTSQRDPIADLRGRLAPRNDLAELEQIVGETEGPILADEFMGLLTLKARPLYLQPFEVTQLAEAGAWDQSSLLASIRGREFPAILIHHFKGYPVYEERWTKEMLTAVVDHYAPAAFLAETIVYLPRDRADDPAAGRTCAAAPWRLPTSTELGAWRSDRGLLFMGEGYEGSAPVYAVADGVLARPSERHDAVAIQHDDPLRPGEKVWSCYGGMASAWSRRSFVDPRFAPGEEGIPVKQGQLLGYQGQFSGQFGSPTWVHLDFAIVPAEAGGACPGDLTEGGQDAGQNAGQNALDPAPYLGLVGRDAEGQAAWRSLQCRGDMP